MASVDPIADALTKIRNASQARHPTVELRPSRTVERILTVLKQEGYIRNYRGSGQGPVDRTLRVYLKYADKTPAIRQLVRASRPGKRMYRGATALPRVLRGLGVAIVSTSQGVMAEREAYRLRVGGEVICYVW
jgi:small subunit ribosomal protein S8